MLLEKEGWNKAELDMQIHNLTNDIATAKLLEKDRVMLEYVYKVVRNIPSICKDDILPLRTTGFDDAAIHDICTTAAYFCFVNRIANGLGVELE